VGIFAEEDLVTHSGYSETVKWVIQCKHYAGSGRNVSEREIGDVIGYLDTQQADGLFIMTDTDLSGTAVKKLRDINISKRHPYRARFWNKYELVNRLNSACRHLLVKYFPHSTQELIPWPERNHAKGLKVLFLPDMSILAYQILRRFQQYGLEVRIFRDTVNKIVMLLSFEEMRSEEFDVTVFFRAELFNFPVPITTRSLLERQVARGGGVVLTPWSAWTVNAGINPWMARLVPVNVVKMDDRHFEHHEEDVFVEWRPLEQHPILDGVQPFTFRTTREFLETKSNSKCVMVDSDNNPAVIVSEAGGFRSVYINCCSHNCLRMNLMPSPIEHNEHLERIFWNAILWASGRKRSKL